MKLIPSLAPVATIIYATLLSASALSQSAADTGVSKMSMSTLPPIERIVPYTDEDYGFKLAVPENWLRIYADEDERDAEALEPGYAVAFESPRAGAQDVFADYLMIEVLPGSQSGAFDSDGSQRQVVMVDGRVAVTDMVQLDNFEINGESIDLVVYQAEIVELGYTVAVFAIGEKHEAKVLADAFALALKTLKVPDDPFSMS